MRKAEAVQPLSLSHTLSLYFTHSLSLSLSLTHTHTHIHTYTHAHTRTLYLPLSLSLSHAQYHAAESSTGVRFCRAENRERARRRDVVVAQVHLGHPHALLG